MIYKIRFKTIIYFLGILIIPIIIITNDYFSKKDQYIQKYLDKEKLAYDIIVDSNLRAANDIFAVFVNQPEVIDILQKAQNPDKGIRDDMRTKLYSLLKNDYNKIKRRNVRQFHFIFPDCESFLRFHRPDRYGDNLADIRYSMKKANADLVTVHGFEEGSTYNGFRNVYPIISEGEHLGAVEISISYKSIIDKMDHLFKRKHLLIIRKEIVLKKVIESELSNYKISDVCDEFMYEKDLSIDKISIEIFENIHGEVHSKLQKDISFATETRYLDQAYLISFLAINNIKGDHVAYLISYEVDDTVAAYFNLYLLYLIGILFITFIIYYQFLLTRKKNERIKSTTTSIDNLNKEIIFRERMQEELKAVNQRLIESQSIAKLGHWELDIIKNNLVWSDEIYKIFDLEPQQFKATYEAFLENIHPEDRDMVNKAYADSLKTKIPYNITHRLLLKNGEIKYVNEICITEFDESGKALKSNGTVQDITVSKQAEKAKQKLEKLKGVVEMAGAAAHELSQPLQSILMLTEYSLLNTDKSDQNFDNIEKINEGTKRLGKLISKIQLVAQESSYETKEYLGEEKIVDLTSVPAKNPV